MLKSELIDQLIEIQNTKSNTQTLEVKNASTEYPPHLYETLSSFSNQDSGGIIIFGIDEKNDFEEVGVYNAQKLQQEVTQQCNSMEPKVRPLFTVLKKGSKTFISAEIPALHFSNRPCYYKGKGKTKGSYIRVGEHDKPMTEFEVYRYESYRQHVQNEVRLIDESSVYLIDDDAMDHYLKLATTNRPFFKNLPNEKIKELLNLEKDERPTLLSLLLFSPFPQSVYPQLSITAVVVPGIINDNQIRLINSKRIEGNITTMLQGAIEYVEQNTKISIAFDEVTGMRSNIPEYPPVAIREAILNALLHRDYSAYTERIPIEIVIYNNRIEIINPGGLYGGMTVEELGYCNSLPRNQRLVEALEIMQVSENRHSGIITMRNELRKAHLAPPVFIDERGSFKVIFYNERRPHQTVPQVNSSVKHNYGLESFLKTPRTKKEIAKYLDLSSVSYAFNTYVKPLIDQGIVKLIDPDNPNNHNQKYYTD